MKKSLLLVVMVLLLLATTAAPGVAKSDNAVQKTSYYSFECFDLPVFEPVFYTGNTVHVRGATGYSPYEWVYDGGWFNAGTNSTVINVNAKGEPDSPFFTWDFKHMWGTFDVDLGGYGHYEGTWSDDKATGKEVGGKRLVKTDLAADPGDFPDLGSLPGWVPEFCSPIIFTIFG